MAVNPPGSGGFLHTHTPVDASSGSNPGAPTYPNSPGASTAEWPTGASASPLTISTGPTVSLVTATSARITWTTNRAADTRVEYGTTQAYGKYASATSGTSHQVDLSGLVTATPYFFKVISNDGAYIANAQGTFTTS